MGESRRRSLPLLRKPGRTLISKNTTLDTRQPKLPDLASQQTPNITTPNHKEGLPLSARPQRASLPFLPPVWVPDAKTDACMRCARPFGLVRFTVPLSIRDHDSRGSGSKSSSSFNWSRRHRHSRTSRETPLRRPWAIAHVKTTVPPGLLGMETSSDLFGRTRNPYNEKFSSGASTGGGGALLRGVSSKSAQILAAA
ncbi:hypothetical protein BD769DRAFT_409929 [Suillus cothurnatus]|nr:hypothetical protein BD769DRAFT_409929 [Suillus cothurnatus]